MRGLIFAAVAACSVVAAPLALAHDGVTTVHATENEWGITGIPATLKAGTQVHLTVTNRGRIVHELVLERGGCPRQCAVKVAGQNAELENIAPGGSKSAVWTITKPGTYTFTCRKPGHWNAGMRRTLTVT